MNSGNSWLKQNLEPFCRTLAQARECERDLLAFVVERKSSAASDFLAALELAPSGRELGDESYCALFLPRGLVNRRLATDDHRSMREGLDYFIQCADLEAEKYSYVYFLEDGKEGARFVRLDRAKAGARYGIDGLR